MTYNITSQPVRVVTDVFAAHSKILSVEFEDGSSKVLFNNYNVNIYSPEHKLILTRLATGEEIELMNKKIKQRENEEKIKEEELRKWKDKYRGLPGVDEPDLSFEGDFSDLF